MRSFKVKSPDFDVILYKTICYLKIFHDEFMLPIAPEELRVYRTDTILEISGSIGAPYSSYGA
jgi:hypothetical protein